MIYYKQTTNKLFFNELPYKITVKLKGSYHLRKYKNLEIPDNYFNENKFYYGPGNRYDEAEIEKIKKFANILKDYIDKGIKLRYDHQRASIYIKELSVYQELILLLQECIVNVSEPKNDADLVKLLENKKYTLCDKLPYGKYKYKISFKEMPHQTKINLILWAKKYSDNEIKITKSTEKYFMSGKTYYGAAYCYVKDKNMALLVSLAIQGNVRKTEEFVIRNDIKQA